MGLQIQEVGASELPGNATAGFKLLGSDGETVMFFHWSPDDEDGTSYKDVLEVLPDRLEGMGHEKETDAILAEVIGIFGVGN